MQHGDGFVHFLFIIGLEKEGRDSGLQTSTTASHAIKFLGIADDIIARSRAELKNAFLTIQ